MYACMCVYIYIYIYIYMYMPRDCTRIETKASIHLPLWVVVYRIGLLISSEANRGTPTLRIPP